MEFSRKTGNSTENHHFVSFSKRTPSQKWLEKIGLLKRFFDWITKGADKLYMGKPSCPT